ncbi:MAG: alpha/beta hydrolase [Terriglobia bacterium]
MGDFVEEYVQFRNARKEWLRGMMARPRPAVRGGAPGVILLHGFTADRMESHWIFVKCARTLAQAGIASLRFDFYGSGESDGEFREVTLQGEVSDALAAVSFFRGKVPINPKRVGLLGLSLGGAIAATIAGRVKAEALVLWAALAHPAHLHVLAERSTRPIAGADGLREFGAHEISPRFLEGLEKVDPLQSISHFTKPVLIIHPENDAYLPLSHPEDFLRAAGSAIKEKIIIPNADHTFTSVAWERQVIELTVEWLAQHLS